MSNIIPFESGNLPAYLKSADAAALNDDLLAHGGTGGFPVISIKGKVFAVRRDGVRTVIPNPKDPDSAATSIEVVLLKVNKNTSKVYYATGWKEGDDSKPTCFSNDGKTPDASVEKPQAKSCATCKHNQWGSKISDSGTKLKSCSDSVRMAVAPAGQLNDPMLLRVPAASMKAVAEYGAMLKRRNVPYNSVVTRIGFDIEAPTPKLTFKPLGFMPPDQFEEASQMANAEIVDNIVNGGGFIASDSEPTEPPTQAERVIGKVSKTLAPEETTEDEIHESVARAMTPKASEEDEQEAPAKKAKPAAAKKATKVEETDVDLGIDLDDLDFDD